MTGTRVEEKSDSTVRGLWVLEEMDTFPILNVSFFPSRGCTR